MKRRHRIMQGGGSAPLKNAISLCRPACVPCRRCAYIPDAALEFVAITWGKTTLAKDVRTIIQRWQMDTLSVTWLAINVFFYFLLSFPFVMAAKLSHDVDIAT